MSNLGGVLNPSHQAIHQSRNDLTQMFVEGDKDMAWWWSAS